MQRYNAPAHTSMRKLLAKNKPVIILKPPYLPDVVRADFFLFPKLKRLLKVQRFATIEEIKNRKKRWHKCITSKGVFFEGEKIVIDNLK